MEKLSKQEDFRAAIGNLVQDLHLSEDQKSDSIFDAFQKGIRSQLDNLVSSMPLRLIDIYLGGLVTRHQITESLINREDYKNAVNRMYQDHNDSTVAELYSLMVDYLGYVMFSHRWEGAEPLHEDVVKSRSIYAMDPQNKNVAKLQKFCCTAAKCGFRWAWSDTCCINKQSSAEESESINSMFRWYRHSALTVVYLHDVDDVPPSHRLSSPSDTSSEMWYNRTAIKDAKRDASPTVPLSSDSQTFASSALGAGPMSSPSTLDASVPIISIPDSTPTTLHAYLEEIVTENTMPPKFMQDDTQVEPTALRSHLMKHFVQIAVDPDGRKPPEWCSRVWTLQEMLAPRFLRFYSRDWGLLERAFDPEDGDQDQDRVLQLNADKRSSSITDHRRDSLWNHLLTRATGVDAKMLTCFKPGMEDIREKLRWASKRQATKLEDSAYSLLGIFDLNMPVIHGERDRAFIRLQEEIMKRTDDLALFDWSGSPSCLNSFLAANPSCFQETRPEPNPISPGCLETIHRAFDGCLSLIFSAPVAIIDVVKKMVLTPPLGHSLVNGELNITLFEYRVTRFKYKGEIANAVHYTLKVEGLAPVNICLPLDFSRYQSEEFYLCRAWDRRVQRIIEIFFRMVKGKLGHLLEDLATSLPLPELPNIDLKHLSDIPTNLLDLFRDDEEKDPRLYPDPVPSVPELHAQEATDPATEPADSEAKLHTGDVKDKEAVFRFFSDEFTVFLVRVKGARRERVKTVGRVLARYPLTKLSFVKAAERRCVL
ncbi:hypothetical protein BS17DRAFT_763094 [Gyrodon lividus]|nr:hypothetical protein BS17DRAFT_763094 [Gyrodon lividus]